MAAWLANQKKPNRKTRKPCGKTTFLSVRAGLINLIGIADQRTFMIDLCISGLE